jgi:hypothetical protein
MQFSLEAIVALATIVGTATSVLAVIQSRAWLVFTSLFFVILSIIAGLYARKKRLALNAASTEIEGHSIDSLNIANLKRRVNRTLVIQEAHHTARIEGEDLEITWQYSGYCKAYRETAIDFSIDSDDSTAFENLNCVAFDLARDPGMVRPIRPLLVGSEGISRKLSVPFLEPLKSNESFAVLLKCALPLCVKTGFGYYTSTLSFTQDRVRRCEVRLIFAGPTPSWLRVYECSAQRRSVLLKTLPPIRQTADSCEYLDVDEERPGQSARIYTFWRDAI